MKKTYLVIFFLLLMQLFLGESASFPAKASSIAELRKIYSQASKYWPVAEIDEGVEVEEIGLLAAIPFPENNPYSDEKFDLGKRLFNDGNLSRSKQIACASCHDRDLGWADGRKASFGHDRQRGNRNSPTIENVAYSEHFFWDGRAATLEQQALLPIQDPIEMNFTLVELEQRLNKDSSYRKAFKVAFDDDRVTANKIALSLATYQRTIVSRRSDFDRFLLAPKQKTERLKAIYRAAISDKAIHGLHLFRTKARCMNCHYGPTFSDQKFHNIGLTYYKRKYQDLGRYQHTQLPSDVGKFKTPGLRGVMNTAPWMHNGFFANMTGVLNIYNAGGVVIKKNKEDPLSPETSTLLKPLSLTREEISALVEFLKSISAPPALGQVAGLAS